jgi:hypothetical protein
MLLLDERQQWLRQHRVANPGGCDNENFHAQKIIRGGISDDISDARLDARR